MVLRIENISGVVFSGLGLSCLCMGVTLICVGAKGDDAGIRNS